jgi:uncharacterized protein
MKLEQSFEVDAPLDRVWDALVDVERVAPCIPGAAVTGRNDDGSYNGTFTIKIGPTTASYAGKLEMQTLDEAAHTATMHAHGSDRRGQGGATATIVSTLSPHDSGTRVEVITDYHITGRLARFGRGGMIEDISERLLRDFAGRLQSSLAGGHATDEQPTVESLAAVAERAGEEATAESAREPAAAAESLVEPAPALTEVAAATAAAEPATGESAAAEPATAAGRASQAAAASAEGSAEERGPEGLAEAAPSPPPVAAPPPPRPPEPPQAGQGPPPPPPPRVAPPPLPPPPLPQVEPAPPVDGLKLAGSVLLDRIRRNPAPVIAIAGGLLAWRIMRRRRRRWR